MINFKLTGVSELVDKLGDIGKGLSGKEIDKAVELAAEPVVQALKSAYEPLRTKTGKASRDTHIGDSVQAFQRKRKGTGLYFAYYIGPRWAYGGNLAYILEYGTIERQSANKAKGGIAIKDKNGTRFYGATFDRGYVKPMGIVRNTYDTMKDPTNARLKNNIMAALTAIAKRNGIKLAA